ncbi:MAG: carboxypeptidase regulatory-like domain-containing protein, partial [Chloroflexi bacterium]|nr:carboxypeptidase regulatory-like domain-containing protein [Chloroflexota bacterium]
IGEATVSGTVSDNLGNPVADAFVHIGDPETGMRFGTPADSSGNYTLAIKAGSYMMGAEKPGYVSEATTITVSVGANTRNLTVTKTSLTISGYVYLDTDNSSSYNSGEGVSFGFVHAAKLGGGFAGTPVAPDGSYTLYVSPGDWKLYAAAEGYQEKPYAANPVTLDSASLSGINILLSDTVSLASPKAQPFTPASGTTLDDQNAGVKIVVPPMAAGSETSDFQIQSTETSNLPSSPTSQPLGGTGKKITFFDASGNPVTTLDDAITIAMTYTKDYLVTAGFTSLEAVSKIKMAYWDDSASAYVTIPTTITYSPSSGTTWDNLVSVTFKGSTTHVTVFSPIVTADGLAPAAPTAVAGTGGSSQVTLTWTVPTTNADNSTLTDLLGYEVYRATSATGNYTQVNTSDVLTASYTDTTVSNGTTYYYKVTTGDTGGNESAKSSASSGITPAATTSGGGGGGGGGGKSYVADSQKHQVTRRSR